KSGALAQRVAESGVDAGELAAGRGKTELKKVWIPGVEIFSREIHPQRHRGSFGELAREAEGVLGKIKLWPRQWSAAGMFANSAKGFHIHPPSIPADTTAEKWLRRLFVAQPQINVATIFPRSCPRSEEHTSELQSPDHTVCRLQQ